MLLARDGKSYPNADVLLLQYTPFLLGFAII